MVHRERRNSSVSLSRVRRRRRRRFRTDNKFPTKVSRFNVDKVVVPATRFRLEIFETRAKYILTPPVRVGFRVSSDGRGFPWREEGEGGREGEVAWKCVFSRFRRETTRGETLEFYVWRFGVEVCQLHPSLPTLRNSSIFL